MYDYDAKNEESNVIWLLGALQAVMSVIYSKSDVIFIEKYALLILITICQGKSKINNEYLKHLKLKTITIKPAGGDHHLYGDNVCQKVMNIGDVTPSKDEKKCLEQYTEIHYLIKADEQCSSDL